MSISEISDLNNAKLDFKKMAQSPYFWLGIALMLFFLICWDFGRYNAALIKECMSNMSRLGLGIPNITISPLCVFNRGN